MYMYVPYTSTCMMCTLTLTHCRPKGENVDVKALGDYDGGMLIVISVNVCHTCTIVYECV